MKLNRDLQRLILVELTEQFPKYPRQEFFEALAAEHDQDEINGNLMYLQMHGMVKLKITTYLGGGFIIHTDLISPTEKAFDFLAEDGGLSAILGVVTVKLHADTIRDLLAAKISTSDIPESEKNTLLQTIKSLPDEGLKHLTTKLIDYAVDQAPNIALLLGKLVGL